MIGNKKQEKNTGKQGNEGETEVETTHLPEGSQQALGIPPELLQAQKISESILEN